MTGGNLKAALCGLAMTGLGACGTPSATQLPDARPIGRPLLSAEEQKQAIADLERRRAELNGKGAAAAK